MSRAWVAAVAAVVLAVLGVVVALVVRDEQPRGDMAGGADSALGVLSRGGTMRIQGGVEPGAPVVRGLPHVCVTGGPVALVGVELQTPDEGLRVGDVLVTVDERARALVRPGRRLASSRLVEEASTDNIVVHGCDGFHTHPVYVELVLDRRALATAEAFRYVYEDPPGGQVRRTDWVDAGQGLDTRRRR